KAATHRRHVELALAPKVGHLERNAWAADREAREEWPRLTTLFRRPPRYFARRAITPPPFATSLRRSASSRAASTITSPARKNYFILSSKNRSRRCTGQSARSPVPRFRPPRSCGGRFPRISKLSTGTIPIFLSIFVSANPSNADFVK